MYQTIPHVAGGRLFWPGRTAELIIVGTSAWYDWLDRHVAFTFVDLAGPFTAFKTDHPRSGASWQASRMRGGMRSRFVLGPTRELTLSRLQAAAQALAGQPVAGEPPPALPEEPTAAGQLLHSTSARPGHSRAALQARLSPPQLTGDEVPRPRLLERLHTALGGKVTLLCAPAGYGKTTVLAQWVQEMKRLVAWLTLDSGDNDLSVFVHSLASALQRVFPDACRATTGLLRAALPPPAHEVGLRLVNDLADLPADVVLVLDDYQFIQHHDVHSVLDQCIRDLPTRVHLVLATRSEPPLPLAKWRAKGQLCDLRVLDLCFTQQETQALLARAVGDDLARTAAGGLTERTEGWIAALSLAVLSLRRSQERETFPDWLQHFPNHWVSSYLLEEVLDQQAPAFQQMLLRLSVLESFCAESGAATLGGEVSARQIGALLEQWERSNVMLIPLDERQGWYRFHPLFKQLLEQRLQGRVTADELAALHRRASSWYAEQELVDKAIRHALAAGDGRGAAQMVEARFLPAFNQEQWVQVEQWLRLLPEDLIGGRPGLLVARAWILQVRGQLENLPAVLTRAEQQLAARGTDAIEPDDQQAGTLRALIALGWGCWGWLTGQAQASLESARAALERTPPGETYVASQALFLLALSNQATGKEEAALIDLHKALRSPSLHMNGSAWLLFAQAVVYLKAGKLLLVEQAANHLLRLAQDADLALSLAWAHWLLGAVSYEQNNLDEAIYHYSAVIADRHRAHFLVVQRAMCGLACACQAQGLEQEAQATARALLEWVQGEHNLRGLIPVYAFHGQLALSRNELEEAQQWIELAGEQEALGPTLFFEDPIASRVRLLLLRGDGPSLAVGQALLDELAPYVEARQDKRKQIQVLALQALVFQRQGRLTEALEILERALTLGRHPGFVRTLADLPLAPLLLELRKSQKARQSWDRQLDAYQHRLLAAMRPPAAQDAPAEELAQHEGLERLTERELQILRMLDKNLSNKEIARELVVTTGTVKVHTNNLYRKLSVNNRRAAIILCKSLGLLPAT